MEVLDYDEISSRTDDDNDNNNNKDNNNDNNDDVDYLKKGQDSKSEMENDKNQSNEANIEDSFKKLKINQTKTNNANSNNNNNNNNENNTSFADFDEFYSPKLGINDANDDDDDRNSNQGNPIDNKNNNDNNNNNNYYYDSTNYYNNNDNNNNYENYQDKFEDFLKSKSSKSPMQVSINRDYVIETPLKSGQTAYSKKIDKEYNHIEVKILGFQIKKSFLSSYTVYNINTKTNHAKYGTKGQYSVQRRYSHFLSLYMRLLSLYPDSVVPIPPHRTFEQSNEFSSIENSRIQWLQVFLDLLVLNQDLGLSPSVIQFLTESSDFDQYFTLFATKDMALKGFSNLIEKLRSTRYSDNESDKFYLGLKNQINALDESIKMIGTITNSNLYKDLEKNLNLLSEKLEDLHVNISEMMPLIGNDQCALKGLNQMMSTIKLLKSMSNYIHNRNFSPKSSNSNNSNNIANNSSQKSINKSSSQSNAYSKLIVQLGACKLILDSFKDAFAKRDKKFRPIIDLDLSVKDFHISSSLNHYNHNHHVDSFNKESRENIRDTNENESNINNNDDDDERKGVENFDDNIKNQENAIKNNDNNNNDDDDDDVRNNKNVPLNNHNINNNLNRNMFSHDESKQIEIQKFRKEFQEYSEHQKLILSKYHNYLTHLMANSVKEYLLELIQIETQYLFELQQIKKSNEENVEAAVVNK